MQPSECFDLFICLSQMLAGKRAAKCTYWDSIRNSISSIPSSPWIMSPRWQPNVPVVDFSTTEIIHTQILMKEAVGNNLFFRGGNSTPSICLFLAQSNTKFSTTFVSVFYCKCTIFGVHIPPKYSIQ